MWSIASFVESGSLNSRQGLKCEYIALTDDHIDYIIVTNLLVTRNR